MQIKWMHLSHIEKHFTNALMKSLKRESSHFSRYIFVETGLDSEVFWALTSYYMRQSRKAFRLLRFGNPW